MLIAGVVLEKHMEVLGFLENLEYLFVVAIFVVPKPLDCGYFQFHIFIYQVQNFSHHLLAVNQLLAA